MEYLRKQHTTVIYSVLFFSAPLYFYLYYQVPYFREISDTFTIVNLSWSIVPVSVVLVYETWLWRALNPRLDYSGKWEFLEDQHSVDGQLDYRAYGSMKIEQSTRRIQLVEGITVQIFEDDSQNRQVATWHSTGCSLDEKTGQISAALDHLPNSDRQGGAIKYGVEILRVSERGSRGRPTRMSAKVYHCVGWGEPRVVTTEYTRV